MTDDDKKEPEWRNGESRPWWTYQACPNCRYVGRVRRVDDHYKCDRCHSPLKLVQVR